MVISDDQWSMARRVSPPRELSMATVDAPAPTISIRERYRDVVSNRWPITVAR